jgi:hypothetical protein
LPKLRLLLLCLIVFWAALPLFVVPALVSPNRMLVLSASSPQKGYFTLKLQNLSPWPLHIAHASWDACYRPLDGASDFVLLPFTAYTSSFSCSWLTNWTEIPMESTEVGFYGQVGVLWGPATSVSLTGTSETGAIGVSSILYSRILIIATAAVAASLVMYAVLRKGKRPTTLPSTSLKFCRECGAKIPRDSMFCEQCGKRLVS